MPNDPFVDVGGLSSLGALRYLDVRDQAAFDAAHAPGAVRVPLDEWDAAAKAADTGFAKTDYWDNELSTLGLRAYIVAGAPEQTRPLGSFEGWSRLVRDALVWLGEPDPVQTIERTRTEDPQREALAVVLAQWRALLGLQRVSVKGVIDKATDFDPPGNGVDLNRRRFLHPEFREALLGVAGDGGNISGRRLGKWLSSNKGKVVSDLRVVSDGILEGVGRYRLQQLQDGNWV